MKKSKQKGKAFGGLQVFSRAKRLALLSGEKRKDGGKLGVCGCLWLPAGGWGRRPLRAASVWGLAGPASPSLRFSPRPRHPLGPPRRAARALALPANLCPGGGAEWRGATPPRPFAAPSPARRGRRTALARARGGHVGRRGAAAGRLPRRPRQRCRLAAPRGAAGRGHGCRGRRGTAGRRGGPGRRRSGPARRGGGSGAGASAAAEGAAVGGAAGAVRGAGAGAALLRALPALLDVRRHPRPRRAAAGRAERLLGLQPRVRRHRGVADGRAAGAGAALPALRREVATGPAAAEGAPGLAGTAALLGRPPLPPPVVPRTRGGAGGGGGGQGGYFYAKRRLRLTPGPVSPGAVRSRIKA